MMGAVYSICEFLQKNTLRLFGECEVVGLEHVPVTGPLIVVANHQSNVDPSLLATVLPRRIWFLGKEGIFRTPVARWFLSAWGAFPLRREERDARAFRWVLRKLMDDQAVGIFPEGTRSRGTMKEAHTGIARLALATHAPLLPVGMTGTERLVASMRVWYPRGSFRFNIGTPFLLPAIDGRPSKEVLESLTEMIMLRLATLLPEEYQGVYRAKAAEKASMPNEERAEAAWGQAPKGGAGPTRATLQ